MTDLLIRNVPPETVDALKRRAKRNRRSAQSEALELLERAAREETSAERLAVAIAEARRQSEGKDFPDAAELIRQGRER